MKYILIVTILFFAYLDILPCMAQEKKFKQTLDSLSYYLNYSGETEKVNLLTFYNPGMFNKMSERFDSMNYLGMTYNDKTKIVISSGNVLYMLDLSHMDSISIVYRSTYFMIRDLNKSNCFFSSAESRVFNGKYGGIPVDEIRVPMIASGNENSSATQTQDLYFKKIEFYLKEAILYSKKVRPKKKDLWKSE